MSTIATRSSAARERRGRRNRDVVEEAEPHRAVALGVVAGRPHQRERRLAAIDGVRSRLNGRAGGQPRDLVRLGRRVRVRVEHRGTADVLANRIDVPARMDESELIQGGGPRRRCLSPVGGELARHRVEHVRALGALGVAGRRHMRFEDVRRQQEHESSLSCSQSASRTARRSHR